MLEKGAHISENEHLGKIQCEGESYLQKTLASHPNRADRERIVCAALQYLQERARNDPQAAPVSSQAVVFSQATGQQTRDSSFMSTLAASLDFDMQVKSLVKIAVESANLQLLPVLTKCLSILAKKLSITEDKEGNLDDDPVVPQPKKRKMTKRKSKSDAGENGMYNDVSLTAGMEEDADDDSESATQGRTGQAFVDDFVTKLVQVDGRASSSNDRTGDVFLASVARESPLSTSATRTVLLSLLHRMRTVSLFELPAYVYQTLLFASAKGGLSLKKQFLVSLAQLFRGIEEQAMNSERATQCAMDEDEDAITSNATTPKQIHQVQGTTLFHIEYALKQDPALVAELVKLAKSNVESQAQFMTPFGIAVLMAVARSPSCQTEVLGHIRDSLIRFQKERSMRKANLFAARVTFNDKDLPRPSHSVLEAATRAGGDGWEFIAEPFFHFANMLLDRPVQGEKSVGIDLLRALFCAQPWMRKPIMEQIVSRIALREKSAADAITVLRILAKKVPLDVLEHSYFIRQSIEDCVRLPPSLADALISAIKPLLRSRRDLLDYFFLVMRKALFHRESSNRAVAAFGFLNLLAFKTERVVLNKSKTPSRRRNRRASQSTAPLTDADLSRIKAATQPLRRAITHPPALRALLYKEIGGFLSGRSPTAELESACNSLKGLLRPHLLKFIDAANAPYILIDLCVDESAGGILHEPLGDLIQCLSVIESLLGVKQGEETYIVELARKLATVALADFSISKDTSNDTGAIADDDVNQEMRAEHAAALANKNRARVLGNVTEALISATVSASATLNVPELFTDVVFPLLQLRSKVIDVLKHLNCATASDAIRDLGGDSTLEASYALPFGLRRSGRPSANPKKPGKTTKTGKGPGKSRADNPVNSAMSTSDFRFGAFNILFSAAHSPTMPLVTAIQCLEKMTCGASGSPLDPLATFFDEKEEDHNVADLHSYLIAIAMKHIQNACDHGRKTNMPLNPSASTESSLMSSAVCGICKIAMRDFKRSKHRGGNQNAVNRLRALQIIEACAKSISCVFGNDHEILLQLASSILPASGTDSDGDDEITSDFHGLGIIENLLETLIKDKALKECLSLLRTYAYFTSSMEQNAGDIHAVTSLRQRQMEWSRKILSKYATLDAAIVRSLTTMATLYSENNDDLRVAAEVIERIHIVIGHCDAATEPPPEPSANTTSLASAQSIQQTTSLAAMDSVLDTLDHALGDVEWCLSRMSSLDICAVTAGENRDQDGRAMSHSFVNAEKNREKKSAQQTIRAEDAAQTRLEGVIRNLQALASCAVAKWTLQERLLRTTTRAYKQLSVATQAQVKRKGDPRTSFISMLDACKGLAPILWTYLSFLGTEGGQDVSSKGGKVSKEARIMPQLIYEVELFEKLLISAQKHTRINLLKGMRRNTARDFRIQENLLKDPHASNE